MANPVSLNSPRIAAADFQVNYNPPPYPEHTRKSIREFTQKILKDIEQMKDRKQKIEAFAYIPVHDFEFNWDVVTDPEEVLSEEGAEYLADALAQNEVAEQIDRVMRDIFGKSYY